MEPALRAEARESVANLFIADQSSLTSALTGAEAMAGGPEEGRVPGGTAGQHRIMSQPNTILKMKKPSYRNRPNT